MVFELFNNQITTYKALKKYINLCISLNYNMFLILKIQIFIIIKKQTFLILHNKILF